MNDEKVYMSLATIPERQEGLKKVIASVLPQVDHLFICLNGYPDAFQLNDPKITVARYTPETQIYDHGKWLWSADLNGYHFTIDDDIEYPANYVEYMIRGIEKYRRHAVVGLHGIILPKGKENRVDLYMTKRKLMHFWAKVPLDKTVHILGSGALAYHTSTTKFGIKNLGMGGTDMQLAIHAQKLRLPMICLAHEAGWLKDIPSLSTQRSICRNQVMRRLQESRLSMYSPWRLYKPMR